MKKCILLLLFYLVGIRVGEASYTPCANVVLNRFLTTAEPVFKRAKVAWTSRVLVADELVSDRRVNRVKRADQLINAVFDQREMQQELIDFLMGLGGLQPPKPELWNAYFTAYDRIVTYTNGYQALLLQADAALPRNGLIVDYGAGTGNFAASLVSLSDARRVIAVDISPFGLEAAQGKLSALNPQDEGRQFLLVRGDITKGIPIAPYRADGAVLNNVLYTLPRDVKKRVLLDVFRSLKPGARLFLTDPVPTNGMSPEMLREFFKDLVKDAVQNGAPMSEFDLILAAGINKMTLTVKAPFLSPRELRDHVEQIGFVVEQEGPSYYNRAWSMVLRRP